MQKYDTVIFGATFYAVSYASNCSENCVLIESSINVGNEYIHSYKYGKILTEYQSDLTKSFLYQAKKRKLIDDEGNYHLLAMRGLISKFVLEKNLDVFLDTRAYDIKKKDDGFEISLYNKSGIFNIFANKILDTTMLGVMEFKNDMQYEKYIGAIIADGNEGLYKDIPESAYIEKGLFDEEYMIYLKVDKKTSLSGARKMLIDKFKEKYKNKYKISTVAQEFFVTYNQTVNKKVCDGYVYHPSVQYKNFADAFESGALCIYEKQ